MLCPNSLGDSYICQVVDLDRYHLQVRSLQTELRHTNLLARFEKQLRLERLLYLLRIHATTIVFSRSLHSVLHQCGFDRSANILEKWRSIGLKFPFVVIALRGF